MPGKQRCLKQCLTEKPKVEEEIVENFTMKGIMKLTAESKEILIIKNITREGPGILGEILTEHGIKNKIIDLSLEEKISSVENYAAVVVLGGPDSANDETMKMKNELVLIKKVLDSGIPYLGICLGLQTMVKAAGGKVIQSPVKEIGFRDQDDQYFNVELTESGRKDPLFNGIDDRVNVFHLHGETVLLTDNMELLAEGKYCRNQIVKSGTNAYGIQCHFELTAEMFEAWINEDPDLLNLNPDQLRADFRSTGIAYEMTGIQLFRNFLRITGFCL
jgi:GMP synthase (glutamine-hydrolysing)